MAAIATPLSASTPDDGAEPKRIVPKAESTEAAEPSFAVREGVRVVVDPETGEIVAGPPRRQTEALSAPLAKALSRSTEGLRVFDLPSGGKGVHLDGRFQHALVVRLRPDGSFETVCTNHPHEAAAFLKDRSAETQPQSREK